jgi:CheY-like chemotaxis protein
VESTTATVTQKTNVHLREALGDLPILIVDDSIAILKMMKKAIQNECDGVEIVEAKNGEEAYQAFVNNNGFDLVLTDIQMPVLDGIGFARKVRAYEREKGKHSSVIVGISANEQEKVASDAKAAGMDGFMTKPFKLSSLLDIINEIERSSSAQKGRLTRAASDGDGTGTLADKKLLMVDDSEPILRMMSNLISSKAKANVTQARDGSQASACVAAHAAAGAVGGGGGGGGGGNEKSNHFDVIVTDIQMPTMDGFQAARKIRALESERGLVPAIIVGISANTSERMATDAQASGMDAFLTKPFNIHDLEQACGEIVSSRSHESGHGDVHIRRLSSSATIFVGGTATTADELKVKQVGVGEQKELPV